LTALFSQVTIMAVNKKQSTLHIISKIRFESSYQITGK
jgi:hypothetical protein